MLLTPSLRIPSCNHCWTMLTPSQQEVVREQWRMLTKEIESGTRGIQMERSIAQAIKAMCARWIDFPLEVLWHGVSKADWSSGAQGELVIALMDLMGWVDLARELADLHINNRPMPRMEARTLWEAKHELNSAGARVEGTMIILRRLELPTLGYDKLTSAWRAVEAKMDDVRSARGSRSARSSSPSVNGEQA